MEDVKEGLGTLVLDVKPHSKVYIEDIRFTGNKEVPAKTLRKQMETKDWGIFSFITESGVLKREVLNKDVEKIRAYYQDHGFLKAQVGEPVIDVQEDKIVITIPIDEGDQYKISSVEFKGDLIKPAPELAGLVDVAPGQVFSRSKQERAREKLAELYATSGYAKVRVAVDSQIQPQDKTVAIGFNLRKGPQVYLERIAIKGNTRTRDKVIRREMGLKEGDLFNLMSLRRSGYRLRRLGYFEEVDFKTRDGSAEDKMVLDVKIKEKATGIFNFGFGYSTDDGFVIMASIAETNLFGRGQQVSIQGTLGFQTSRYILRFVEPWLFDRPLRWSTTIFNTYREYEDYDRSSVGGSTGLGYPIWGEDLRAALKYTYEEAEIGGVADDASLILQDMRGWHSTSSLTGTLRRDTLDVAFNPSRGSNNFVQVEYAGLGGTNYFTKYTGGSGWYFPLPYNTTFFAHGKIGYVQENPGGKLPLYEKFYLGGINSLRGFKFASVSPRDPLTGDRIGGEKMLQFNFEFIFPLIPDAGIKGLVFFDAGNVWLKKDDYSLDDLRQSVGVGVRWYSPIGPLRLEYGWTVRREEGDPSGGWEFSIGTLF